MQSVEVKDQSIPHRLGSVNLHIIDQQGQALARQKVRIHQVRHEFDFAAGGFVFENIARDEQAQHLTSEDELLASQFFDLFNTTTLPFYWGQFEPERGHPRTQEMMRTARYLQAHHIKMKGHPLTWHTVTPRWLTKLPLRDIEELLRQRIRREVSNFAGVVDMWDALNESVISPVFTAEENGITKLTRAKGRIEMIRLSVEEARRTNPNAFLLLNDFNLGTAYECLIEGVLEAGISLDAIGLQTHMHQGYLGEEYVESVLERFARYGLPLHMTENTLLSGHLMPKDIVDLNDYQVDEWPSTEEGEARQADEIVRHYRTIVKNPATESITYWDYCDKGAWLGAPSGLLRKDGSAKPAYHALHDLIKGQWWVAPSEATTDEFGAVGLTGWAGFYELDLLDENGSVVSTTPFTLSRRETGTRELMVSAQAAVES